MSTPFGPPPREKREELHTYRELSLKRELKSIRGRRRLEAGGSRRVIGNGTGTQPYLAVAAARYRAVRLEVERRLLVEARRQKLALSLDQLREQLHPRIEALTYAQLAGESARETQAQLPVAALGRGLTREEREQFASTQAAGPLEEPRGRSPRAVLNQVLGAIERRQVHNPARYQTLWAGVVGAEVAQQTYLEAVDPATQTAYFRCLNSVLSTDLQRRPGLVQKLSRVLGVPVRRLRARF